MFVICLPGSEHLSKLPMVIWASLRPPMLRSWQRLTKTFLDRI
jgi:hypothetical protein